MSTKDEPEEEVIASVFDVSQDDDVHFDIPTSEIKNFDDEITTGSFRLRIKLWGASKTGGDFILPPILLKKLHVHHYPLSNEAGQAM